MNAPSLPPSKEQFFVGYLRSFAFYFKKDPEAREQGIKESYLRSCADEMEKAADEIERLQVIEQNASIEIHRQRDENVRLEESLETMAAQRDHLQMEMNRVSALEPPLPEPEAWCRLIDSPHTLHPQMHYTNQRPTISPDKWQPLYAAPPASSQPPEAELPTMKWDACSKGGLWTCVKCGASYCSPPWSRKNAAFDHRSQCSGATKAGE